MGFTKAAAASRPAGSTTTVAVAPANPQPLISAAEYCPPPEQPFGNHRANSPSRSDAREDGITRETEYT